MTVPVNLTILPGELAQIVQSVFSSMLDLAVGNCQQPWYSGGDRLTAAVQLAGNWNGVVLIECDRSQACRFAGRYLSIDPPEMVDDVVRDVFGELANMIGGNVKSAFTQGIQISMPSVIDGTNYSLRVCGAESREQLSFECSEGTFWVTILTSRA